MRRNFATLSAPGVTNAVFMRAAMTHTVQVTTTGAPATCSLQLEGTLDNISKPNPSWENLSGTQAITATPTTFHVINRVVRAVRVNLTALSGGTVTVKYQGEDQ